MRDGRTSRGIHRHSPARQPATDVLVGGHAFIAPTFIGKSGNTGPGGKLGGSRQNHHLHIKFARRNPADGRWYLFDPYAIYATPGCYPDDVDGKLESCARYPTVWRDGRPKKP